MEEHDFIKYIKSFQIKGYKSLYDAKVEFKDGLNIIIGRNGSGKSNLIKAVINFLTFNEEYFDGAKISLLISDKNEIQIAARLGMSIDVTEVAKKYYFNEMPKHTYDVKINSKEVVTDFESDSDKIFQEYLYLRFLLLKDTGLAKFTTIGFGLPNDLSYLDLAESIELELRGNLIVEVIVKPSILSSLFQEKFALGKKVFDEVIIYEKLNDNFKTHSKIVEVLKKYSPIENLRFADQIRVYKDKNKLRLENIKLEYLVNNKWVPWAFLSDGTKRLFYIIYELTNIENGVYLIEEPELGIHPHQFHQIMQLIKEESQNKQIIMSTHSPQALNVLGPDELDRIIISEFDPKKGSTFRHLTKKEQDKARKYMNEVGFLSDYWMYSDLEG